MTDLNTNNMLRSALGKLDEIKNILTEEPIGWISDQGVELLADDGDWEQSTRSIIQNRPDAEYYIPLYRN